MAKMIRTYSQWRQEKLTDAVRASRYLNAAYRESREAFLHAVKNVIQANQVTKIAKEVGVTRESVYRSFSAEGNPAFYTIDAVLKKLDIAIEFNPVDKIAVQPTGPATIASSQSGHKPSAAPHATRRHRTVVSRSNRSSSSHYAQLTLAFPVENAKNANKAGKATPLSEPSGLATFSSFRWTAPIQQTTERTSVEFNAMFANVEQAQQSSINDFGRGWV